VTAAPESSISVKSGAGSPSTTTKRSSSSRRAVGIVRVSRIGGREGERFASPGEQRERIRVDCEREGLHLSEVIEELDVSGGATLEKRHGLRRAIELVEAGQAEVVVVAYFDRLVRSLAVQAEILERVEGAGGAVLAVDVGEVRADTASRWLSSTMHGMVAEYARRVTAERTEGKKRRAVEDGIPPFPNIPPGYRRRDDRRLEPDPATAPAVVAAFELRASGATVAEVRDHLRERGIKRSYHGVQTMLESRIYLGELRFGATRVNEKSHEAIVDPELWQRVQRTRSPRGRRAKSDRLLARLGVLRCATCGGRMIVGTTTQGGKRYPFYRCSPIGDCPRRVTVSADLAERVVVDEVKRLLADVRGKASVEGGVGVAVEELDRRQGELDRAIRAFGGLEDEAAARERLAELREARDEARERLDELERAVVPAVTVSAGDWDLLTLDERRALVRAVVEVATVAPGRGPGRISVEARGE
jgi:site-specific DNA recombinase